jgi:glycosyltransferase involved in cell wall biosynthesis
MKIVVIGLTSPFRGGIAHYTTVLCHELAKHHEITLLALKRQYPRFLFPASTQKDHSRNVISFKNTPMIDSINPVSWLRTTFEIAQLKPDLVLFQWWQPFFGPSFGTIALLARKFACPNLIFLCHNVRPHESSLADRILTQYGLRSAAAFIVQSEEDRANLVELFPQATIVRTPHPTYDIFDQDSPITQDEARRELGVSGPMLLFFGNVRAYKGLPCLLRALPKVLAQRPVTLVVAGEFYEGLDEAEALIKVLGIQDQVRLLNQYVPNEAVRTLFAAADVLVLPYLTATQSGVAQVAFHFQKGVITTAVGGLPEVVAEGETGLLVPPEDPDALAQAILDFYEREMAGIFAHEIKQRAAQFSWDRMRHVIETLFDQISRDTKTIETT